MHCPKCGGKVYAADDRCVHCGLLFAGARSGSVRERRAKPPGANEPRRAPEAPAIFGVLLVVGIVGFIVFMAWLSVHLEDRRADHHAANSEPPGISRIDPGTAVIHHQVLTCPTCHGTGQVYGRKCTTCDGAGWIEVYVHE